MNQASKIKPQQWKAMEGAVTSVKETSSSGGFGIIQRFMESLNVLQNVFKPLQTLFDIFSKQLAAKLQPTVERLFEVFLNPKMIEVMMSLADIIIAVVEPAFMLLANIFQYLIDSGFIQGLINIFTWFGNALSVLFNSVIEPIFKGFIVVWNWFAAGLKWVWDNALAPVFNTVVTVFKAVANSIIVLINGIIAGINWFIPGSKNDLNYIPLLDLGGVIAQSGLVYASKGETFLGVGAAEQINKEKLGLTPKKGKPQIQEVHIHIGQNYGDSKTLAKDVASALWGL